MFPLLQSVVRYGGLFTYGRCLIPHLSFLTVFPTMLILPLNAYKPYNASLKVTGYIQSLVLEQSSATKY